ncbi:MAG: tRNA (cytidine(34)-2'-O)-methyltransferase [Gammaproteobacteria bacterium]
MFHVILWQPEIPPNTGNIIRLCANTGAALSLVGPLGFELDEPRLRRAGLDYHEFATVRTFTDLDACLAALGQPRLWAFSARAARHFTAARFCPGDALLFGPETRGLPAAVMSGIPTSRRLVIPMRAGNRSLNLSNAVAVAVYEAWRQQEFAVGPAAPA